MFNIILGIYIIVAIFVIGGGTFTFYKKSQSIAALLFFVGALVSFILFGLKWFSSSTSVFSKTPVSWPPTVNTCPDYLIYDSKANTCIDLIGVSKNGALKKYQPGSSDFFSLQTASSEPEARKKELCTRAIAAGLTWEGITNGESCTISMDTRV